MASVWASQEGRSTAGTAVDCRAAGRGLSNWCCGGPSGGMPRRSDTREGACEVGGAAGCGAADVQGRRRPWRQLVAAAVRCGGKLVTPDRSRGSSFIRLTGLVGTPAVQKLVPLNCSCS